MSVRGIWRYQPTGILMRDRWKTVPAWVHKDVPGLAVTESQSFFERGQWVITHVRSGRQITVMMTESAFTLAEAGRVLTALAKVAPWERTELALKRWRTKNKGVVGKVFRSVIGDELTEVAA